MYISGLKSNININMLFFRYTSIKKSKLRVSDDHFWVEMKQQHASFLDEHQYAFSNCNLT